MKHTIRLLAVFVVICLVMFVSTGLFAQYKVGDTVKNFRLKDVTGKFHMLNQYKGNVILLNFFATW